MELWTNCTSTPEPDFLASIKLAVILLVIFGVLLSWATVLESKTSTEHVQRVVYQTFWFDLFLFLLGLNVTCSALSRLPWKKRHTGFVVTHAGIIIILIGSMITRKLGVEGQMMLQEGRKADYITLNYDVLSVALPRLNVQDTITPDFSISGIPKGKALRFNLENTGAELYVNEYFSNPRVVHRITNDGNTRNPAVQVQFHRANSPAIEFEQWLLLMTPL